MSTVPACVLKAASTIVNNAKRTMTVITRGLGWSQKGPAEGKEGVRPIERWSMVIRLLFSWSGRDAGLSAAARSRGVPIRATLRLMNFSALCRAGTGKSAFPHARDEIEETHLAAPLGQ